MTARQLDRHRKQLEQLADSTGRTAAALEDEVRSPLGGEASGGLSNAPVHLGDLGSEAYTQELDATLLENETFIRDEALAALERLDAGTYGRCAACGTDIASARLDALPYARQCVACAAAGQSGLAVNMNDGRPEGRLGAAPNDTHAAGTPGGGTEVGGLAGTNVGSGAPDGANLERAMSGAPPKKRATGKAKAAKPAPKRPKK